MVLTSCIALCFCLASRAHVSLAGCPHSTCGGIWHRVMEKGMGAGSEAALVSFPGGWKALLLGAAGKCARVFVSPLVFGFPLNVCASRSQMIDVDMRLVSGLHCLRLYEVLTEGRLPYGSQKAKAGRSKGSSTPSRAHPVSPHFL